jgi:signal transduction histidine kinase
VADPIAGSVFLGYLLTVIVVTAISFAVRSGRNTMLLVWRMTNLATLLSAVGVLLSIRWPYPWLLLLSSLFVAGAGALAAYTALLVSGRKPGRWFFVLILAPLPLAFLYSLLATDTVLLRMIVSSIFSCLLAAYMAVELGIAFWQQRNQYHLLLAVVSLLVLAGYLYRIYFIVTARGLSDEELRLAASWLALAINLFLFVSWNSIFAILTINDYQQQLRDSEHRFRLVVENSPNPIWLWDQTGALTYVSPVTQTMLGYDQRKVMEGVAGVQAAAARLGEAAPTPERLVEAGVSQRLIAENWLQAFAAINQCIATPGVKVQAETYMLDVDGNLHTLAITSQGYARTATEFEVVSVAHDISELRAMHQLLQEANAALEQQVADRTVDLQATVCQLQATMAELQHANAGKDAFLAAVSHELRTPLTAILTMGELLESQLRGALNPDQAKYVIAINKGGQRLLATVNHILLYTSLLASDFAIEYETCRLAELCAIAVRSIKATAEQKQQRIVQTIAPANPVITSYAQGIVQMLKILLDNAVKFTPEGGRIEVQITEGTAADAAGKQAVYLAVCDTGIGMDAAQQAALFHAFTQGDLTLARRYEGLGLGLAYIYELVKRLDGSVTVASTPGAGSCFTVTLPVRPCAADKTINQSLANDGVD